MIAGGGHERAMRRPVAVLVGVAAGFFSCVAAGWVTRDTNIYAHFVRFHTYINPLSLYYPTASEVRALVRAQCPPDRVLVVVGGNSVFWGAGQPADAIWTARLQAELGDGFCVVNLAVPRSLIGDYGAVALNMFRRGYPRALLVEAMLPNKCGPPDGDPIHRYLFWDAYRKGLLSDQAIPAEMTRLSTGDPELDLRFWLDAPLRFTDLWTREIGRAHV